LVNLDAAATERRFSRQWLVALIAVAATGAQIGYFIYRGAPAFRIAEPLTAAPLPQGMGNVEQVADVLFSEYLLPFEIASVLLLVAVDGPVVMAKKTIGRCTQLRRYII